MMTVMQDENQVLLRFDEDQEQITYVRKTSAKASPMINSSPKA